MLMGKYGRDFAVACMDNTDGCVSKRVRAFSCLFKHNLWQLNRNRFVHFRSQRSSPSSNHRQSWSICICSRLRKLIAWIGCLKATRTHRFVHNRPLDRLECFLTPSMLSLQESLVPTAPDLKDSTTTAARVIPSSPARHPAALLPFPSTPPVDPPAAAHTVVISTNLPSSSAPLVSPPLPQGASEQDAFDALTRRFAELKKR